MCGAERARSNIDFAERDHRPQSGQFRYAGFARFEDSASFSLVNTADMFAEEMRDLGRQKFAGIPIDANGRFAGHMLAGVSSAHRWRDVIRSGIVDESGRAGKQVAEAPAHA